MPQNQAPQNFDLNPTDYLFWGSLMFFPICVSSLIMLNVMAKTNEQSNFALKEAIADVLPFIAAFLAYQSSFARPLVKSAVYCCLALSFCVLGYMVRDDVSALESPSPRMQK
jgi:hypothetical protein